MYAPRTTYFSSKINSTCNLMVPQWEDPLSYSRRDGILSGFRNPLDGWISWIFLCYHEEDWINNCPPEFKPIFYRRYLDDIFVLFNNPSQIQPFLQYLNKQQFRMKFTLKSERNNSLAFFNINVVQNNSRNTRLRRDFPRTPRE